MTGYERITRILDGLPVDRPAMMLHSFMAAAAEAGVTMRHYREDPVLMARALVAFADKYGLDGVFTDIDTALAAGAFGAGVDFPENEPARVAGPASGTLEEITARVTPERLAADPRVRRYIEAHRLVRQLSGDRLFLRANADQGPFSLAMLLYGMENFLMALLDDELAGGILALIEKCRVAHLHLHQLLREAGADMTSFGDSSCGPDLVSRDIYLKYAQPFHQRLRSALSASGIRTVCHICGNLDKIAADVAAVGFAGVEVDYKTDLARARDVFAGRSVVFGPLDPSGLFMFGAPALVAEKTRAVLDLFSDGKGASPAGLVIGAGCALPPGVPEANIRAFVETVRDHPQPR
jgi:uroporphyrinogen decarboxylase